MSVSAKDLGTGQTQQVTITGGTALAQDDIDQMISDAESHANDDKDRSEHAEARNQADHTAYQTEKQLTEHGEILTEEEKQAIDDKIMDVRKGLSDDASTEELQRLTNELLTGAQVLGQKIYEASQAEESAGAEDEAADDVVEAEIVEDESSGRSEHKPSQGPGLSAPRPGGVMGDVDTPRLDPVPESPRVARGGYAFARRGGRRSPRYCAGRADRCRPAGI